MNNDPLQDLWMAQPTQPPLEENAMQVLIQAAGKLDNRVRREFYIELLAASLVLLFVGPTTIRHPADALANAAAALFILLALIVALFRWGLYRQRALTDPAQPLEEYRRRLLGRITRQLNVERSIVLLTPAAAAVITAVWVTPQTWTVVGAVLLTTGAAYLHWRAAVRPLEQTERTIRDLH